MSGKWTLSGDCFIKCCSQEQLGPWTTEVRAMYVHSAWMFFLFCRQQQRWSLKWLWARQPPVPPPTPPCQPAPHLLRRKRPRSRPQQPTVWVWACRWPRPEKEPIRNELPRKPRPWTGARGTNCSATYKHHHHHHHRHHHHQVHFLPTCLYCPVCSLDSVFTLTHCLFGTF